MRLGTGVSCGRRIKSEQFRKTATHASECLVRLTREYTDGGTSIRSEPYRLLLVGGFTGMPSVYPRMRHPSETANWRLLR